MIIDDILKLNDIKEIAGQITNYYAINEDIYVKGLLDYIDLGDDFLDEQKQKVEQLISDVRAASNGGSGIDAFLQQYSLDTQEGIILMCLAEALLRIPDGKTADALIEDKLSGADWDKHIKQSDSLLVNASTYGLLLTGKITNLGRDIDSKPSSLLGRVVDKIGEPFIRQAMFAAMKIMGKQFVLGRNIAEALKESADDRTQGYTHSFDMLGESALTAEDAKHYQASYLSAIKAIGNASYSGKAPKPTISIKLSALHPRYEQAQSERVLTELYQTVLSLMTEAKKLNVGMTIDAEEMDRLELSLELFEKLYTSECGKGWGEFGMVVQTYSKRAFIVLHYLNKLAQTNGTIIPVRLVKGAYWDSEIKLSQQNGAEDYPVFTRKVNTDVSYLACANYVLNQGQGHMYPQFATHNAQTVVSIIDLANRAGTKEFEFQRLHGMGQDLYNQAMKLQNNLNCRIYAPVGAHKDLLPYLVRRLLENGANTSFVHKLVDLKTPISLLANDPIRDAQKFASFTNQAIKKPRNIFDNRLNSAGVNLNIQKQRELFFNNIQALEKVNKVYDVASLIAGKKLGSGEQKIINSPQDNAKIVGKVKQLTEKEAVIAIDSAVAAYPAWNKIGFAKRAELLNRIADLFEENKHELIYLCTNEAGKTLKDGIDEVREAIDFCRYYAQQAVKNWGSAIMLPSPTGETNELCIDGRGVFVCISPWNFPLAIFAGQIVATLVTGNCVIAKPAEQTAIIAYRAIELMHEAGVPQDVLHLVCGSGSVIGQSIIEDKRIAGVCFTGSTKTAKQINITLAQKDSPIIPFIAETGGQNAMIVDSTSLPEQVVKDVVSSAFTSAGQRCSALRVLYLQNDIADKVIELLHGAMQELVVGDPSKYSTDIGPVIDAAAQENLQQHINNIAKSHKLLAVAKQTPETNFGSYVLPSVVEINSINELDKENFGPILHVIRFDRKNIDKIIEQINSTGYGLTFGIQSRNETFAQYLTNRINSGNIYINRNQIGAIVGVNPFGGHGLSGTGPKAGGPHYLARFINEKTISNNITAIGGNALLLMQITEES